MGQLLGAALERDQVRLRATGLARSTFQDGKRRAYGQGWLCDRYIPAPAMVGVTSISFALLRPYADRLDELVAELSASPETVLLWESEGSLLAVLFHRVPPGNRGPHRPAIPHEAGDRDLVLTVDAGEPSVPVYFDFEGAWCRWTGVSGPRRYPRPLPLLAERWWTAQGGGSFVPPPLRELLRRPFDGGGGARPPHLLGPRTLPRSQRRLLSTGQVEWRVLPDLARLPPYHGVRLSRIVLVHGTLRPGARLLEVFQALVQRAGTRPFLVATDRQRTLLGFLGARPVAVPDTLSEAGETPALLDVLSPGLSDIGISRLATAALRCPVFHRYDRLVLAPQRATVADPLKNDAATGDRWPPRGERPTGT